MVFAGLRHDTCRAFRPLFTAAPGAMLRSMATREKARLAKEQIARQFEGQKWLRGVGLGGDGPDYAVQVNVARLTRQIAKKIPKRVLDVDVIVEEVGDVQPYGAAVRK
jgi:hypothetical protein